MRDHLRMGKASLAGVMCLVVVAAGCRFRSISGVWMLKFELHDGSSWQYEVRRTAYGEVAPQSAYR